ncbi:hypothetical protein DEIPH_ctg017orf0227 [Deinococcus phoenicis]|uniref:Uncharacterized protein n=1 Tax=Deinococcus phoenicis TaxID=1476583 RepID=A0A016QSR9_9DEIO|nr:hypothetical protein [Deinococcus phoenicis]EYB68849.1 hypothetical protein DEIPH_ctg017orf0227 [Deinococcus phoenicis]
MTRDRRPADTPPRPPVLNELTYVALRLHEAAIRKDGTGALNMATAVASVDAARALLEESRQ